MVELDQHIDRSARDVRTLIPILYWIVFTLSLPLGWYWVRWSKRVSRTAVWGVCSAAYIFWWHWLVFVSSQAGLMSARALFAQLGLAGLFFLGLSWVVWGLERASETYRLRRLAQSPGRGETTISGTAGEPANAAPVAQPRRRIWNPLDPDAWYYGRSDGRKLHQSLAALVSYSLAFLLAFMLFNQISGCREVLDAGRGGEQKTIAKQVKIQKVIKKKYVINPYSSVIFNPPPIDEVKLQLEQATAHMYKVGYGSGERRGI